MQRVTRFSPAKINLTLAVGAVRPDGFHPLESIVSLVDFGDRVTLTARPDDRIVVECDAAGIPTDDMNLAARAARRLREEIAAGREISVSGVTIRLDKCIPPGAGLGGGSSNAAAALLGLRELWNADLPASRLAMIGAEIGSDVPLFLAEPGRLIVMRGRGEQIELLGHSLISTPVLLAIPTIHSPTGAVYRRFDELPAPPKRPSAEEIFTAMDTGLRSGDRANASIRLFNDLQESAESLDPALREFRKAVEEATGQVFMMTGSGAAYFTLYSANDCIRTEATISRLQSAHPAAKFILTKLI